MKIRLPYQFIETLDGLDKALILLYLDGHSYAANGQVLGISEFSGAKHGA